MRHASPRDSTRRTKVRRSEFLPGGGFFLCGSGEKAGDGQVRWSDVGTLQLKRQNDTARERALKGMH